MMVEETQQVINLYKNENTHKNDKIAIFDSGIGGVSFLAEIQKKLPLENFIYYGDLANAPYGSKSREYIAARLEEIVDFLLKMQIKALVLACNTATSAAIKHLRQKYTDLIIVGMEPAIQLAVNQKAKRIIVLSTPVTSKSPNTLDLIAKHQATAEIINLPCPGLMELVEAMDSKANSNQAIADYLIAMVGPHLTEARETMLVLGCTHYIFLAKQIKELFPQTTVCHGNTGTANNLEKKLAEAQLLRDSNPKPTLEILSSADQKMFLEKTKIFLEKMGTL